MAFKKYISIQSTFFTGMFLISLIVLLFPSTVSATTITWDGGGVDNNWFTADNWDTDTIPTISDIVVFDSTSTDDVEVGTSSTTGIGEAYSIEIDSAYTGTIENYHGIRIDYDYTQAGGTVNVYRPIIVGYNGIVKSDLTLSGGTLDFSMNNTTGTLSVSGDLNISGGTFTAPGNVAYLYGDITIGSGATFNHNNGQIFWYTEDSSITNTIDVDSTVDLYILNTFGGGSLSTTGGVFKVATGDIIVIEGDSSFGVSSKIVTGAGAYFDLQGSEYIMKFREVDAVFQYSGTSNQTINMYPENYDVVTNYDIKINKSSGTVTAYHSGSGACVGITDITVTSGTLDCQTHNLIGEINGDLTIDGGTFMAPSAIMEIGGDFTFSSGVFDEGSGEVVFSGTETSMITGDITFYDFTSQVSGKTIIFEAGSTITVTNDFTVNGDSSGYLTLVSSSFGTEWNLDVGNDIVSFVDVQDSDASLGSSILASDSIDSGNNTNWSIPVPTATAVSSSIKSFFNSKFYKIGKKPKKPSKVK